MDFATIPRQGPTSRTLESNSKPEPIAEKDGKDQANPVSLLPLTLFRKLKKDYKLFWPHGDLEVQPGVRPIGDEECYELLKRGWARIDDAPRSNRTNLFYAALRAQRRHSHGSTSVIDFVAIKEIVVEADRDLVRDRKAFENAKEEFKHLSKIEHCHIIASLDMFYLTKKFSNTGTTQHHFVILLYPLAKRNLDQHLKILSSQLDHRRNSGHDVVLDEAQALKLINYLPCLCQAVLYLHNFFNPKTPQKSSPIRHRDIKPQNILIDTSEEILLADFDISKQYEDTESAGTWGNTHVTDEYAAGVLLVEGQETKRSFETDVISLGFVCLEILTVILGASRDEMFRSFPSKSGKYGRGSFAHGKALELGATWEWIRTLLKRARTGQVPEKLKGNVVVLMIRQIILMMRADFGAKGVLEEAYACFSGIADPCEHCKRESGNAVKCRSKSTTPTRLACKNQNSVRYAHSASDLRTTTMPLRHSPLRRIQSNHQIDAGGMSQTISPICCTLCERHPYMLSRPTQPLQSNGGLAQHSCRLHDHPRCDEEASAHDGLVSPPLEDPSMLDRDCAISGAEIFVPPLLPLSNEQITPRGGSLSEDAGSSGHIRNPARAPPRDQSEVRFPATPPRLRTPILKRVNSANSTYRVFSAHNGRSRKFTYDGSCDELKMSIYEYIAPTIFHLQATMEKRDASDFTKLYPRGIYFSAIVSNGQELKLPGKKPVKLRDLFSFWQWTQLRRRNVSDFIIFYSCMPDARARYLRENNEEENP